MAPAVAVGPPVRATGAAPRPDLGRLAGQHAADLGCHPAALGPACHTRRDGLHHLAHRGHPRRAALLDHLGDDRGQLGVAELRGKVSGEDSVLGPLRSGLISPPRSVESIGRLAAPPGLPGEHAEHLVVAEITGRLPRHLLVSDRGEDHAKRPGSHLVARLHCRGKVGAKPILQFSHEDNPAACAAALHRTTTASARARPPAPPARSPLRPRPPAAAARLPQPAPARIIVLHFTPRQIRTAHRTEAGGGHHQVRARGRSQPLGPVDQGPADAVSC